MNLRHAKNCAIFGGHPVGWNTSKIITLPNS